MLPTAHRLKKAAEAAEAAADNPKKLASLIDLANLPSPLRDFLGRSQCSRRTCFIRVWSYSKTNNRQDPNNQNMVKCDDKLKGIMLGESQVKLSDLPQLIKLHFPKQTK